MEINSNKDICYDIKLTCVTVTYNCVKSGNREKLKRCIESVANLKTKHEHLIYDGASTDGTLEILRELEVKIPYLKVVSEPDTGIYNALNKGIRDAKGEWFYVLGSDDYISNPLILDNIIKQTDTEDIDAIVTTVRRQTSSGEYDWFTDISQLNQIFTSPCVCHQGELIKTRISRDLGGFDEMYKIAADSDMFFKAHLKNLKFKYIFNIFAYFSCGGCSGTNWEYALKEHRISVANVLRLNPSQKKEFIDSSHLLPTLLLIKLLKHPDICIHQSSYKMLQIKIQLYKRIIRKIFYPLVWVTRPIRHKRK